METKERLEFKEISVVTGDQVYLMYYNSEPEVHYNENGLIEINGNIREGRITFQKENILFHVRQYM